MGVPGITKTVFLQAQAIRERKGGDSRTGIGKGSHVSIAKGRLPSKRRADSCLGAEAQTLALKAEMRVRESVVTTPQHPMQHRDSSSRATQTRCT